MKIFVVDDEKNLADLITQVLSGSGFTVFPFYNPEEILTALTKDVDLVISDVNMPAMNGFELAHQIAVRLGTNPPKTLLMSGDYVKDALHAAPKKEIIGVLKKPFSLERFVEIVEIIRNSRNKCPCALKLEIACPKSRRAGEKENFEWAYKYCYGDHYVECPKYDYECGEKLREWISEDKE